MNCTWRAMRWRSTVLSSRSTHMHAHTSHSLLRLLHPKRASLFRHCVLLTVAATGNLLVAKQKSDGRMYYISMESGQQLFDWFQVMRMIQRRHVIPFAFALFLGVCLSVCLSGFPPSALMSCRLRVGVEERRQHRARPLSWRRGHIRFVGAEPDKRHVAHVEVL